MNILYFGLLVGIVKCVVIPNYLRTEKGAVDCCESTLMDTSGQVIIETGYVLPKGIFSSLKVHLCNVDEIYIQIWTSTGNGFKLKWQMKYGAQFYTKTSDLTILSFPADPVTITSKDHLGVYSSTEAGGKIPIPYTFVPSSKLSMYKSKATFPVNHQFALGDKVNLDKLRWPRSFKDNIQFCRSSSCSENVVLKDVVDSETDKKKNTKPQTNGDTVTPKQVAAKPSSCDSKYEELVPAIKDLQKSNIELTNRIAEMNAMVRALSLLNKRATGICPSGFEAGWYGVGKCYRVVRSLTAAHTAMLYCQDFGAHLVRLENDSERKYLSKQIFEQGQQYSLEEYWTGGLYNNKKKIWTWPDGSLYRAPKFEYSNWAAGQPTLKKDETCIYMSLSLNGTRFSDFWYDGYCAEKRYYICETSKRCL